MSGLTKLTAQQWREELETELKENILGYWMKHTVDNKHFGFVGEIKSSGEVLEDADKGLVLHARILWTFASAYRLYKDETYLTMARRALETLKTKFNDAEYGGLYWMIDVQGRPSQDKKQVYGQAFVIYALAEYVRATGDADALAWAEDIYRLIEKHAYDPVHLGYVEALARDWTETPDLSLSGKDLNERKSMNTHLHVLEAYTNLYRVWKPEGLRAKLKELIEVHLDKIIDSSTHHFLLFFDDEWQSKSEHVSYGHDIEGSWLLWEAAEVLGDEQLLPKVKEAALQMAKATLEQGVDKDGGLFNEYDGRHLDDSKDWWPQAEAMVGFLNAYQLSGSAEYLEAAQGSWTFITRFVSDRVGGEWHWQVTRDGVPVVSDHQPKVGAWKCPYHNSRACLEALERLNLIEKREA
ncbi:AGE family epimerase/isomerase [Cohnella thermotolerans]|uniref:AGE family epimerase/isomerase n=1 Tax=Cohnella thermotolerans TaxID=329858 RepID=UPI00040FD46C|nr:AGE family epimerase/isomerase [Cohnella thermotolerans]